MKLCIGDFKDYLQEYPSDFPDAQAYEALLQIANDNTGRPMTEYTHYNLPVSIELSLRKSISRHWGSARDCNTPICRPKVP